MTFQEEFVSLLKKHGVEFDERYMWKQFFRPLRGLVVFRHAVPTLARGATVFRPLRGLEMSKLQAPGLNSALDAASSFCGILENPW
jgi:hypothetical protein